MGRKIGVCWEAAACSWGGGWVTMLPCKLFLTAHHQHPFTSTPVFLPGASNIAHKPNSTQFNSTQLNLPALPSFSGESRELAESNPKTALQASLHWTLHSWMNEPELHPQQRWVQKWSSGWIMPWTEEYMWYGPVMRPCRAKRHNV